MEFHGFPLYAWSCFQLNRENPTAILKLWKQEAQMAGSWYELRGSDAGISIEVPGAKYLEEMKGAQVTFVAGRSGLDELAEEKCLPNGGLAHPGSARTRQACAGYTYNTGTLLG